MAVSEKSRPLAAIRTCLFPPLERREGGPACVHQAEPATRLVTAELVREGREAVSDAHDLPCIFVKAVQDGKLGPGRDRSSRTPGTLSEYMPP